MIVLFVGGILDGRREDLPEPLQHHHVRDVYSEVHEKAAPSRHPYHLFKWLGSNQVFYYAAELDIGTAFEMLVEHYKVRDPLNSYWKDAR